LKGFQNRLTAHSSEEQPTRVHVRVSNQGKSRFFHYDVAMAISCHANRSVLEELALLLAVARLAMILDESKSEIWLDHLGGDLRRIACAAIVIGWRGVVFR
jgi:hypothetical protein